MSSRQGLGLNSLFFSRRRCYLPSSSVPSDDTWNRVAGEFTQLSPHRASSATGLQNGFMGCSALREPQSLCDVSLALWRKVMLQESRPAVSGAPPAQQRPLPGEEPPGQSDSEQGRGPAEDKGPGQTLQFYTWAKWAAGPPGTPWFWAAPQMCPAGPSLLEHCRRHSPECQLSHLGALGCLSPVSRQNEVPGHLHIRSTEWQTLVREERTHSTGGLWASRHSVTRMWVTMRPERCASRAPAWCSPIRRQSG